MWWLNAAFAISGTATVGEGQLNVYLGVDAERLERLHIQGANGADAQVIDVGEGLSTLRGKMVTTVGVANRFDFELGLPYEQVRANRSDAPLCEALGLDACKTSTGPGVITLNGKWLAIDGYAGAPISLAVIAEGRLGMLTAPSRARITNRGEGTQDLGARVAVSRISTAGQGFVYAGLELGGRYRFPNTRTYPAFTGNTRAPNPEWTAQPSLIWSPGFRVAFGITGDAFWRPGGLDFNDLDLTDPDRLAALRVAAVRMGGTLIVRGDRNISGSISANHTIYAMNNPYVTTVTAGLSFQGSLWKSND